MSRGSKSKYANMTSDDEKPDPEEQFQDELVVMRGGGPGDEEDGLSSPRSSTKSRSKSGRKSGHHSSKRSSGARRGSTSSGGSKSSSAGSRSSGARPPQGIDEAVSATDNRKSSGGGKKKEINKDFKDVRETGRWGSVSKREIYAVIACAIIGVIVIVVVSVVMTTRDKGTETSEPAHTAPTAAPTVAVVKSPQEELDMIRTATLQNDNLNTTSFPLLPDDPAFYENKANDASAPPVVRAASWSLYDDPVDSDDWLVVRYGLAVIYYATNGDSWKNNTGWLSEESACKWYGVRCDRLNERVEEIDLSSNKLSGSIPNEINLVQSLVSLWLRRNSLTGTVPSKALGTLPYLSIIYLEENKLNGTVTKELRGEALQTLFLQMNDITGFLPIEFCPRGGVGGLAEFGIDCDDMECFCCAPDNCF